MIKSTAVGNARAPQDYPKLMTSKSNRTVVVLFTKESEGTVIFSNREDGFNPVGEFSRAWHMPSFEPWSGKVVIEQD